MKRMLPAALLGRVLSCAVVLAACVTTLPAAAQTRTWDFRVLLDGAPIGHHRYALSEHGVERELVNEARFSVRFLGIAAYRYAHDANERWRAGCLAALTARTDDNGERLSVTAAREGERMAVVGARSRAALEGCVMTFAYWNPAILRQSRLLNAQTGEYETVRVTALGDETIAVRGANVNAARYRIAGAGHPIDLWYSPQQEWLALESTLDGGRRLRYVLN